VSALAAGTRAPRRHGPRSVVSDTFVMTRRNVLHLVRTPQLLVFASIQPVMFVLLFRYVFGGSIHVPGYASYVDFLIPGIIVQTSLFGGSASAVGIAEDLSKGITDRFRSLPMHRGAILAGRTFADLVRNCFTVTLMIVVGMLVGFRFHTTVWGVLAGVLIALFFGYAFSWLFVLIGMSVRNPEAAQLASFLPIFPLVFAASTFTSTQTMPSWLQTFADIQPVTNVDNSIRALMEGTSSATKPTIFALTWTVGILTIAIALAVRRFRSI
jgi:ABC-2 type transport system permease protein